MEKADTGTTRKARAKRGDNVGQNPANPKNGAQVGKGWGEV